MPPSLPKSRFSWIRKWRVSATIFLLAFLVGFVLYLTKNVDRDTFLNYVALGLLLFVFITLFYGIIAVHDVPYEIAKHRNHPHQDAIHAAGWVSLFTLHALWPFLWIWAMLYRPDRGWGIAHQRADASEADEQRSDISDMEELERRITALEQRRDSGAP
jgi:hypothetical protein